MSDTDSQNYPSEAAAEEVRFANEEIIPVAERLTERFLAKAAELALEEGWPPDLAEMVGACGAPAFLEMMFNDADPEEALDAAMRQGRRLVFVELYRNELVRGADRRSAFLKVVELARENSVRAGDGEVAIPGEGIAAALQALEAAAERDLPDDEQVMIGLQSLAASHQSVANAQGG